MINLLRNGTNYIAAIPISPTPRAPSTLWFIMLFRNNTRGGTKCETFSIHPRDVVILCLCGAMCSERNRLNGNRGKKKKKITKSTFGDRK